MKFNPGDPVWLLSSPEWNGFLEIGQYRAVVVQTRPGQCRNHGCPIYVLQVEGVGEGVFATECVLRPRDDDDANPDALASWKDVPFKPDPNFKPRDKNIITVTVTIPGRPPMGPLQPVQDDSFETPGWKEQFP